MASAVLSLAVLAAPCTSVRFLVSPLAATAASLDTSLLSATSSLALATSLGLMTGCSSFLVGASALATGLSFNLFLS